MHNNFSQEELIRWFIDNYECWNCGQNHMNCFHHIKGRGNGDSICESSILNAAPLNNFECHLKIHGELTGNVENVKALLAKTMRWLLKQGYQFNEVDTAFILKYKELYE